MKKVEKENLTKIFLSQKEVEILECLLKFVLYDDGYSDDIRITSEMLYQKIKSEVLGQKESRVYYEPSVFKNENLSDIAKGIKRAGKILQDNPELKERLRVDFK